MNAKYPTGATGVSVQPFVDLENKKGTDTSSVRPETEAQSAPRWQTKDFATQPGTAV